MGKRTKKAVLKKLGVFDKPFSLLPKASQTIARSIDRNSEKKRRKKLKPF